MNVLLIILGVLYIISGIIFASDWTKDVPMRDALDKVIKVLSFILMIIFWPMLTVCDKVYDMMLENNAKEKAIATVNVYELNLIDIMNIDGIPSNCEEITDAEFKDLAERYGKVYTLDSFQKEYNIKHKQNYSYIRFISTL